MTIQTDSLSPEGFQLFVASLASLPKEEIRKAKSLYIRNAISDLKALDENMRAFRWAQVFFMIIPVFWPMLYAQRRMLASQRFLAEERVRNAIAVWKDDLEGERFEF